jgi:hypothetical protein
LKKRIPQLAALLDGRACPSAAHHQMKKKRANSIACKSIRTTKLCSDKAS